uniref:Uncharacterized protein n=1 Tax=Romanomermis culicivorax TaxID=13658 RepID=A0A915IXY2_ROMCU
MGYTSGLWALNESIGQECQSIGLYKLMYPVHDARRSAQHNKLCFVDQTAQRGTTLPITEMQAWYHCAVLDELTFRHLSFTCFCSAAAVRSPVNSCTKSSPGAALSHQLADLLKMDDSKKMEAHKIKIGQLIA